jgi:hypothetical protein
VNARRADATLSGDGRQITGTANIVVDTSPLANCNRTFSFTAMRPK